jgi:hypothetical protein
MQPSQASADSLSSKLAALDLSEDEVAVMKAIVSAAASSKASEVEGFAIGENLLSFNYFDVKCDLRPALTDYQSRASVVGEPGQTYGRE